MIRGPGRDGKGREPRAKKPKAPAQSELEEAIGRVDKALLEAANAAIEAKDVPTLIRLRKHFDEVSKRPNAESPGTTALPDADQRGLDEFVG